MTRSMLVVSLGCAALACATPRAVAIGNRLAYGPVEETAGWGPAPLCDRRSDATSVPTVPLEARELAFTGAVVVRESSALVPLLSARAAEQVPSFDPRTHALVLARAECDAGTPFVAVEGGVATVVVTCQAHCSGGTAPPSDAAWALVLPREQVARARLATCPDPDPPSCGGPPRP